MARNKCFVFSFFLALLLVLVGCSGQRKQFAPGEIPQITALSETDEQYGHEVLNMMINQYPLDRDDRNISRVRTVIEKLAESADSNAAPWHVYVFKDDTVENAAATRGNYIFVWTGILNKVRNDDELAAVLAHELSHVLAGHTQPTPSEEFASMISNVTAEATSQVVAVQGQYGVFANIAGQLTKALIDSVIVNPEGQRKELEADQIGLFLMAKANYDPARSVEFWERMEKEGFGDVGPIQFMTSHPSSEERLEQLNRLLPEAQKLRDSVQGIGKNGKSIYSSEWTIKTSEKISSEIKKSDSSADKQNEAAPRQMNPPTAAPPPTANDNQDYALPETSW